MKKLIHIIVFAILFSWVFIINNPKSSFAEVVVVHANEAWLQMMGGALAGTLLGILVTR